MFKFLSTPVFSFVFALACATGLLVAAGLGESTERGITSASAAATPQSAPAH